MICKSCGNDFHRVVGWVGYDCHECTEKFHKKMDKLKKELVSNKTAENLDLVDKITTLLEKRLEMVLNPSDQPGPEQASVSWKILVPLLALYKHISQPELEVDGTCSCGYPYLTDIGGETVCVNCLRSRR